MTSQEGELRGETVSPSPTAPSQTADDMSVGAERARDENRQRHISMTRASPTDIAYSPTISGTWQISAELKMGPLFLKPRLSARTHLAKLIAN